MPDTTINLLEYVDNYSHWDLLIRYLVDHAALYSFNTNSSPDEILQFLKRLTASSFKGAITYDGHNPGNLLTRGLNNLASGKSLVLDRDNLLRLILALGINSRRQNNSSIALREANHFILNYMHETELSARNLQECIFIWCLHNNLSTIDTVNLIRRYKKEITAQPLRPDGANIYEGRTSEVLDFLGQINTRQQLDSFIHGNMDFFRKLGNTHYCSLFCDVSIIPLKRQGIESLMLTEYKVINKTDYTYLIPEFLIARSQSDITQRTNYYLQLFGLYSLDEEAFTNHLNKSTIAKLEKIFPNVFISMKSFTNLIRRTTNSDIPSGVHLLHMLVDLPPASYAPVNTVREDPAARNALVINPVAAFEKTCNIYLNNVGFPSLNRLVPIERMVLDVYELTVKIRTDEDYKDLFLYLFRKTLQDIADHSYA